MRWTTQNWQTARNKVVRMNTLTPAGYQASSRLGVIETATPTMNGVKLLVARRTKKYGWLRDYFLTNSPTITVMDSPLQNRVLRMHRRQNAMQILNNIGKGFSGYLGADPEIFTVVKGTNRILPAPEYLPAKGPLNEIFWDGFQAEFTTKTEQCLAWFLDHVRTGLVRVRDAAKTKGGELVLTDVIEIPRDMLETADWNHVRFGCDPSKNAYNDAGQLEAKPRELEIRFAGGHKHFGSANDKPKAEQIVKALDAIWGVMSVSLFEGLECPLRRIYYGRAGEYRLPPHGIEYRTPSNAWMCHPAIAQLSWTIARHAYYIGSNNYLDSVWDADQNEVRRIINELDVAGARVILKRNRATLEALLNGYFKQNHGRMETAVYASLWPLAVKHALRVILEGAVTVLAEPKNLVRNWMLDAPYDQDAWYKPESEEARLKDTVWHRHSETGTAQWVAAAGVIERGERI